MKVYGDDDYKGFVLLNNPKTKEKSKHYISAVVGTHNKDEVRLYFRNAGGDSLVNYRLGTNKKVDVGIKTWFKERKKRNMRVDESLFKKLFRF